MIDLFEKLTMERGARAQYAHLPEDYFIFPKLEGDIGPRMKFNGKEVLNWSLNNYLGLANHPEVRKTDGDAASKYGLASPMGARMMSGNSVYHIEFERQLAEFVKKEDAMLLNYGYQGVFSIIDALVDHKDVIVYDSESHACIIVIYQVVPKNVIMFRIIPTATHSMSDVGETLTAFVVLKSKLDSGYYQEEQLVSVTRGA